MNKSLEKGRYEFVPAGVSWVKEGGTGIYVKYGRTGLNSINVRQQGSDHIWIKAPDRELFIVRDVNSIYSQVPFSCNYDEFVSLSLLHESAAQDQDVSFFMMNYTENMNGSRSPKLRRSGESHPTSKIIADSGGFQLLQGHYEYIDPLEVIKWYNENIDIGMILDLPTTATKGGLQNKLAKLQASNTDLMMRNKSPHIELMNIFHGNTAEDKKMFRETVERPDITKLAVGGSYFDTLLNSIDNLLSIITTGQRYNHYHVLGVSNILQVVMLMRIASKFPGVLLTSDSSTHIQKARTKEYFCHTTLMESPNYLILGAKNSLPSLDTLPCQCAVCSRLKYIDILSMLDGSVMNVMLGAHNIYSHMQHIKTMGPIVSELASHDLKVLLKRQLRSRKGLVETLNGIDFIDCVAAEGLAAARKKYRVFLGRPVILNTKSLFDDPNPDVNAFQNSEATIKHVETLIKNFSANVEQMASIHGKKVLKKDKTHRVIQKVSGTKKKFGKAKAKKKVVV